MANDDLDEVIKRLQSCVGKAQQRLDRRQRRLLEHLIEVGKDGEPTSLSWMSRLPSGDGGLRTYELLRVPWASLRSADTVRIASLSIDMDCRVEAAEPADESHESSLTVIPIDADHSQDPGTHRLRIEISGDPGEPERISIDDQPFRGGNHEETPQPQGPIAPVGRGRRWVKVLLGWKCLAFLVLLGLLLAALLWYFKVLPLS